MWKIWDLPSIMSAELAPLASNPDSKVHGACMGPTWGQQDPGGPHGGPMSLAIWKDMPSISIAKLMYIYTGQAFEWSNPLCNKHFYK